MGRHVSLLVASCEKNCPIHHGRIYRGRINHGWLIHGRR